MKERLAIIDGIRTPMAQAGKELASIQADDLAVYPLRELMTRFPEETQHTDEVIIGNVAQPAHSANVARVIALKAGLPRSVPAFTVHRNCASGMESISAAARKIAAGEGKIYFAGGTESMSNIPYFYGEEMKKFFFRLAKSKTFFQKLGTFFSFRFKNLKPEIGVVQGLTDPVSGLMMGDTAEVLSREFQITREEQDEFALMSHQRAVAARKNGIFEQEIIPVTAGKNREKMILQDSGPREDQSLEKLAKLKPWFDRVNGTVTVGNACPITDGAAILLVMSESEAKQRGLEPLGYVRDYAYASLEPERMGLGPVYSTSLLMKRSGATMKDFELIEINEAFAAQVIANERAFSSDDFSKKFLDRDKALGELRRDITNVNGGAIALGHPVGMTGSRIVLHLLKELRRQNKNTGLATLCVGGGQGAAFLLEVS